MSRFQVVHTTVYRYESTVSSSYGQVCLLPRSMPGQICTSSTLVVEPGPSDGRERLDIFGNRIGFFHVEQPHEVLTITARSEVEIDESAREVPLEANRPLATALAAADGLEGPDRVEAAQYLLDSPRAPVDEAVRRYTAPSMLAERGVIECLGDLMARIHNDFVFAPDATQVTSTVSDLFETGAGVCQDFAHLAVAGLRSSGLPARYVSGYLETDPPPGLERVVGADVSHAWASVLIPGIGWIDMDPTNNQFVNDRYITIAWGRDYSDVAPVTGVIYSNEGLTELEVAVDVTRLGATVPN